MTVWRGQLPLILASESRARQTLLANSGIDFEAVPANLGALPDGPYKDRANVGIQMFKPFKLTLDLSNDRLWLQRNGKPAEFSRDRSGMFTAAEAQPAAALDRSAEVLLLHDQPQPYGPPAPRQEIGPPASLAQPVDNPQTAGHPPQLQATPASNEPMAPPMKKMPTNRPLRRPRAWG